MTKEQLQKIEEYDKQIQNLDIRIDEFKLDYDVWCYICGKAWHIIYYYNQKIFAGLPSASTMLTHRSHRTDLLFKFIFTNYKKVNRMFSDNDDIRLRYIMGVIVGHLELDLPKTIDMDHQSLIMYGFHSEKVEK